MRPINSRFPWVLVTVLLSVLSVQLVEKRRCVGRRHSLFWRLRM